MFSWEPPKQVLNFNNFIAFPNLMDFGHGFCFPWRIHVWYTYLHEWLILMGTMYVDNGKYTIVSCILWVLVTLCTAWISSFLLGKLVGEISMHYIRSCWRSVWESKPWTTDFWKQSFCSFFCDIHHVFWTVLFVWRDICLWNNRLFVYV